MAKLNNRDKRKIAAINAYKTTMREYELFRGMIQQPEATAETLSRLIDIEDSLLKTFKKIRRIKKELLDPAYNDNIKTVTASLYELLRRLRIRYIRQFNQENNLYLSEAAVLARMEARELYLRIHRVVFWEMTEGIIPGHPKDEYRYARTVRRRFVIHSGETNTGKTYNALEALKTSGKGVYLGPLRLLALEVFHKLNEEEVPCNLSTGEEEIIVEGAVHTASTVEKLKTSERYDIVIIDEAQMLADRQRGHAWTAAILGAFADEIHVCCSPNAIQLITGLIKACGDSFVIKRYTRDTELTVEERKKFVFPYSVEKADALVVFSKRMVMTVASELKERGISASLIYGDLPPETRRSQVQLFLNGETDVVVATDAIGMGLNLPIRRIVFMETNKYDGEKIRIINPGEVKQISGRAGRRNIYDIGYVNSIEDKNYITHALKIDLPVLGEAYYLPAREYVMEFPVGSLEERLSACMEYRRGMREFSPSNIGEQLTLLYNIRRLKERNARIKLDMEEEYRLVFISFDTGKEQLLECWIGYVEDYALRRQIPYPDTESDNLDELEIIYKELSLYYSFSRAMGLPFNGVKLSEDKGKVADKIHEILKRDIKEYGRTCRICGVKLPFSHLYSICDSCYYQGATGNWE